MLDAGATLYFDFIDPLSFLLELELTGLDGGAGDAVTRSAFELRPPPSPLVEIDDPSLADRWRLARRLAGPAGVSLSPPRLVPWSRKAHELHLLAASHDVGAPVCLAIFEAYMLQGRDIGRVDVLVGIGRAAGLDPTETKAVLDVDRFEADVLVARDAALGSGVADPPVLLDGPARLEGFHNRVAIGTFLRHS